LSALESLRGALNYKAETTSGGHFQVRDVIPGTYWVRVFFHPDRDYPMRSDGLAISSVGRPVPIQVEVSKGGRDPIVIELGGGTCSIRGRVENQDGAPFASLPVLAYHYRDPAGFPPGTSPSTWKDVGATGTTDADGIYELVGMVPSRYRIAVAPEGYIPSRAPQANLLACPVDVIDVSLTSDGEVAVAPLRRATENRMFTVRGAVALDEQFAEKHHTRLDDLIVTVATELDQETTVLDIDETGAFEWVYSFGCGAHDPVVELQVTSSWPRGLSHISTLEVVPFPGGRVDSLLLRYP
jgi:hypothetical protein